MKEHTPRDHNTKNVAKKKAATKAAKKPTRSKLIKKLDVVFSEYIRNRYAKNGISECITCGKKDEWKKLQAGHFISRARYSTRWNEDNVQVQCYRCNVIKNGEQYLYSLYLGAEKSLELYNKSLEEFKISTHDLEKLIEHYESINKSRVCSG